MRKIRKHDVYIILKFQLAIKNTENQHISEFKYKFLRKQKTQILDKPPKSN